MRRDSRRDSSGRLVAVNGLFLDHPHTGTGVYTREVLSRLLTQPDEGLRYAVVAHPGVASLLPRRMHRAASVRLQAPLRRRSENVEKVLWEQAALPLAAARLHVALLYSPYFSLPLLAGRPRVVTIHDLIPLLLPEYAPSPDLQAYFHLVSAATRRASAIVTDSEHSAGDIARTLGVPRARIHVVYLGVDPLYSQPVDPARVAALRARLGLPRRFILYLGGIDPRKNVGVLLRAQKLLHERGRPVVPLAIVAPRSDRFPDPRDGAAQLGVGADTIFLDFIPDEDKAVLYAAATAFAYPSRYEGFGLPPLEAMAAGTPVLCAASSSLPEVAGDAALLLDPDDVEGWANGLERIGADEALRADLAVRGRARARQFTWDKTVEGLRRVFRLVLDCAGS